MSSDSEACGSQASRDFGGVNACMPDIGHVASKEPVRRCPVLPGHRLESYPSAAAVPSRPVPLNALKTFLIAER
jgi:hypothetical protein